MVVIDYETIKVLSAVLTGFAFWLSEADSTEKILFLCKGMELIESQSMSPEPAHQGVVFSFCNCLFGEL